MNAKKIGFALALIMPLVLVVSLVMAADKTSEEVSTGTTVTVNKFLDITLGGVTPIAFGSVDPGTSDSPATGAVTITIESTTNLVTDTYLKGSDFTAPVTLAISNMEYDDDNVLGPPGDNNKTMSTTYGGPDTGYFENVPCPCGSSAIVKSLYFWLTIPSGQQAGSYTGATVYFKTVENGLTP